MPIPLESALVRIWNAGSEVVGAGVFVSEKLVLTCAHVVAQALDIPQTAPEVPAGEIALDVPLVAAGEIVPATVSRWLPVQPDGSGDLACLELQNPAPQGAHPVSLMAEEELWGHPFRAFGFPGGYDSGVWASGVLRAKQADGWIQIEDVKQTGYFIQPGFSGTAIWDETVKGVVGITVTAEKQRNIRAAFTIPVPYIIATFPELAHGVSPSRPDRSSQQLFAASQAPAGQVFICYAREDQKMARRLYDDLKRAGVTPWIDCEDLLPGQKWRLMINQALKNSAYVIVLLSSRALSKRGFVQKEMKRALDLVDELPPEDVFVIPVRLDECTPIDERLQELHWEDLFPSYEKGFQRILRVLVREEQTGEDAVRQPVPSRPAEAPKTTQHGGFHFSDVGGDVTLHAEGDIVAGDKTAHTQEDRTSGQDYFENVGGNFYTGPVTIHQYGEQQEPPKKKPTRKAATPQEARKTAPISLRSERLRVSQYEALKKFELQHVKVGISTFWRPLEYIHNEYEDQGDVVLDHATGLMWQKSGSERELLYRDAQKYVKKLNSQKFGGYDDWRLPTIPELLSLLEPKKQSNGLYINPIFDKPAKYPGYWSADRQTRGEGSPGPAWFVYFKGGVDWGNPLVSTHYVRAVRSSQF